MALIKSALELAMEKTEGVSVDKEELRRKEITTQGRVAAAKAIDSGLETFAAALSNAEKTYSKDDFAIWKKAAAENLLSRFALNHEPGGEKDALLPELVETLTQGKALSNLQKIVGLIQQYASEFQQLKDAIAQQLGPQLRQRAQQAGVNPAKYQMEKDPAYLKVLSENLEPMRAEYLKALEGLKADILTKL